MTSLNLYRRRGKLPLIVPLHRTCNFMYKKNIADICYLPAAISERAESGDKISDTIIPKLYLISKCFAEITPKKKPAARFIVIFLDNILEFYSSLRNIFQKRKLLFVSSFCEITIAAYLIFMTLSCGFMIKYGDNSSAAAEMTARLATPLKKYAQSRSCHTAARQTSDMTRIRRTVLSARPPSCHDPVKFITFFVRFPYNFSCLFADLVL